MDYFFWSQGIGAKLIEFAKETHDARFLWVLEKNVDAIKFYEAHGFAANGKRQLEEGTTEYIVMLSISDQTNVGDKAWEADGNQ